MMPGKYDHDAVVVGSGPNGLAAAILLQQNGLSVLLLEAKNEIGGGLRSAELTLPGFTHDICSAIHPLLPTSILCLRALLIIEPVWNKPHRTLLMIRHTL